MELLATGHRADGGRHLRRVCRHRRGNAQQRRRQAQALADPLKPGNQRRGIGSMQVESPAAQIGRARVS